MVPLASGKNNRADSEMDKQIARLRELGNLRDKVVPQVVIAVTEETTQQVARAEAPSGRQWRLTEDGETPLKGAAKGLTVTGVGSVILMELDELHSRHHLGAVKGKKQRRIIPTGDIPKPFLKAMEKVITDKFFAIMETKDAS